MFPIPLLFSSSFHHSYFCTVTLELCFQFVLYKHVQQALHKALITSVSKVSTFSAHITIDQTPLITKSTSEHDCVVAAPPARPPAPLTARTEKHAKPSTLVTHTLYRNRVLKSQHLSRYYS